MPDSVPVADLPEPSAELILLLALVQAHIVTMPRKRKDAFLLAVSNSLGVQEVIYNTVRFRPRHQDPAVYRAMVHAGAWWRQILGVLSRGV